jgi:hypothetical protein
MSWHAAFRPFVASFGNTAYHDMQDFTATCVTCHMRFDMPNMPLDMRDMRLDMWAGQRVAYWGVMPRNIVMSSTVLEARHMPYVRSQSRSDSDPKRLRAPLIWLGDVVTFGRIPDPEDPEFDDLKIRDGSADALRAREGAQVGVAVDRASNQARLSRINWR